MLKSQSHLCCIFCAFALLPWPSHSRAMPTASSSGMAIVGDFWGMMRIISLGVNVAGTSKFRKPEAISSPARFFLRQGSGKRHRRRGFAPARLQDHELL